MLNKCKMGIKLIIRLLIFVLIGTVLMILVYLIPTNNIDNHVRNSAELFEKEGSYPSFSLPYCNSLRDNFTDAWMLLEASYYDEDNSNHIVSSMTNYRYGIEDLDPVTTIIEHYKNNKDFDGKVLYGRYWNGYLTFLKPLLYLFDYSTIRYINIGFQIILFIVIVFLLYEKGLEIYVPPYILTIFMAMPFAVVLNLQLTNCYTVFNIGILTLLMTKDRLEDKIYYIFLCLGIVTAFIDLLSYPLVTFGIPAVIYFTLAKIDGIKASCLKFLKIGFSWCLGYGGMWISKWIVGSIISGENLILDGFNQFLYRTGSSFEKTGSSETFTIIQTIYKNLKYFLLTPITLIIGSFVVVMIVLIIKNIVKGKIEFRKIISISGPYLFLMIIPFIWYILVRNHSAIHAYGLSNKELLITTMSITFLLTRIYFYTRDITINKS